MPMVNGELLTPDDAMRRELCPECGVPLRPATARAHAANQWGSNPNAAYLGEEARRRFNNMLVFSERPEDRSERLSSRSITAPENQSAATEFTAAILLEMVATPFWEEGTKALFDGVYARMAVAYGIGAIPAIAGLLTVANYWPQLRTRAGTWLVGHLEPLTSDARWWFAVLVFLFFGVSWPRLLRVLDETHRPITPVLSVQSTPPTPPDLVPQGRALSQDSRRA